MISEINTSGIYPLQNLSVLKRIGDEKKVEWARHYIKIDLDGKWRIDLTKYSFITNIEEKLNAIDAFKAAHPNQQPDCPKKERAYKN
ncbi:unnamed protein product [Rotaria sp. Silwood2]|nr:unnamed protein product [Rotaria sp. Silwood2]